MNGSVRNRKRPCTCYSLETGGVREKWQAIAMHLYALTLQKASCITQAIHGNFSGTKQQEIVVGRGKTLELLRPDPNSGKLHSLLSVEVFGLVRAISPFKLTGSSKGTCRPRGILINVQEPVFYLTRTPLQIT